MPLHITARCRRDLRRVSRRGKDMDKLWAVVALILAEQPLAPVNRLHQLTGNWVGYWECHIENNWLLVWRWEDDWLILSRTGTHSDIL